MNYQKSLFSKKGQFGTIWLAAHHPSKLNKMEIVELNLTEKCKEILRHVTNGQFGLPRFSLLISSHLMFGLVVILNKKNKYLLDDLVYFKNSISQAFRPALTPKKPKTPKKVKPQDVQAITLKENLPDLPYDFSKKQLISFEEFKLAEPNLAHIRSITLEEEDIYGPSALIPIELNFEQDSFDFFGGGRGRGGEPDFFMGEEAIDKTLGIIGIPLQVSTEKKIEASSEFARARTRLKDSILAQETIGEDISLKEKTQLKFDQTSYVAQGEPIEETTLQPQVIPQLYQDTMLEMHIPEPQIEIPEMPAPEPQLEEVERQILPEKRPVEKEKEQMPAVTLNIRKLKEERLKKQAALVELAARRKRLIIDRKTEMTDAEMKKRIKMVPLGVESEEEVERELSVFEKNKFWFNTKYDYLNINLIKEPNSRLFRKYRFVGERDHKFNIFSKTVITNKTMTSARIVADKGFYLTEGLLGEREIQRPVFEQAIVAETDTASMIEVEKKRKDEREKSLLLSTTKKQKTKEGLSRTSTLLMEKETELMNVEIPLPMESMMIPQPETFLEQPFDMLTVTEIPSVTDKTVGEKPEIENLYKNIILAALEMQETLTLQALIQRTELPDRLREYTKPRKMLACKLFSTVLNMAASKDLHIEQQYFHEPIQIEKSQN